MGDWNSRNNCVVWVDIPVADLDRAIAFYAAVLENNVTVEALAADEAIASQRATGQKEALAADEAIASQRATGKKEALAETKFAVLDHRDGNGGCLVVEPDNITTRGSLVYLNVNGRIRDAVQKAAASGGSVSQDVHAIGPHGFRALIADSEGNRIALHSETDS